MADLARRAGVKAPIQAGVMPVVNVRQIQRMVSTCGAKLPRKFSKIMARYGSKPEALFDAGISYAIEQIIDLLASFCKATLFIIVFCGGKNKSKSIILFQNFY